MNFSFQRVHPTQIARNSRTKKIHLHLLLVKIRLHYIQLVFVPFTNDDNINQCIPHDVLKHFSSKNLLAGIMLLRGYLAHNAQQEYLYSMLR